MVNSVKQFPVFLFFVKPECYGLSSGGFLFLLLLLCAAWCGLSGCMTLAPLWRRQTLSAHSLGHDWSWDVPPGILFTLSLPLIFSSTSSATSLFLSIPLSLSKLSWWTVKEKIRLSTPPPHPRSLLPPLPLTTCLVFGLSVSLNLSLSPLFNSLLF